MSRHAICPPCLLGQSIQESASAGVQLCCAWASFYKSVSFSSFQLFRPNPSINSDALKRAGYLRRKKARCVRAGQSRGWVRAGRGAGGLYVTLRYSLGGTWYGHSKTMTGGGAIHCTHCAVFGGLAVRRRQSLQPSRQPSFALPAPGQRAMSWDMLISAPPWIGSRPALAALPCRCLCQSSLGAARAAGHRLASMRPRAA